MIKAIIFDCFGVLTTEGWEPFCQKYFKNKPDLMLKAHNLAKELNSGRMEYDEFITDVSELAGVSEQSARSTIDDNVTNQPLLEYLAQNLKPNYKIGILSNAGGDWLGEMLSPKQLALFDNVVLSYKTGFMKPQREIYELAARGVDAKLAECVFIDDREGYTVAAGKIGMKTVLYQNFEQCKDELETILAENQA